MSLAPRSERGGTTPSRRAESTVRRTVGGFGGRHSLAWAARDNRMSGIRAENARKETLETAAILNMAAFHWRRRARRARPTLRTHDLRGFSGAISGRAVSWVPGHIANCWGLGCSQPQLLTTLVASRSWQDEDTATAARSSFGRCVTESLVSSSAAPWTNAEIRDAGWRAREDHVMGCFLRPSPSIPLPPSSRAQVD